MTSSKIQTLLQAWLKYIQLENLTNASVEANYQQKPQIWDEGVSLLEDRLQLDKSLFREQQLRLKNLQNHKREEEFQVALAFPQLYSIERSQRKFCPLFTIDITSIFTGKYRSRGWELTQFEFQPVLPNLIKWYGVSEEEAENLVTREGLKVFLKETFGGLTRSLQEFLELLDLPAPPVHSKRLPYLLDFNSTNFNLNLKRDLLKISEKQEWSWALPSCPAYEYLFGRPQLPRHEVLFFGAFPGTPPNAEQAAALKHVQENSLTAVIGPPGNEKTTLHLHAIAGQVVKRAYKLASTGIDESNLTLVTSTNNRAVNNVLERLAAQFPSDRFYLPGGKKDLVNKQVIPKLQAAIDWLQRETFDETEWQQARHEIVALVNQLKSYARQDQFEQRQKKQEQSTREQYNQRIQSVSGQMEALRRQQQRQIASFPDYSQYPVEAYQLILLQLEKALQFLPRQDPEQILVHTNNWWERLWYSLKKLWQQVTKSSTHHFLLRLSQQTELYRQVTKETPFPFQAPLTRESLVAAREEVALQLREVKQWQLQQQEVTTVNQIDLLQQQLDEQIWLRQQVEQRLASYPAQDFYSRFYLEHHQLQEQLFAQAWQYLQQSALRRKDEVIDSLRTYIALVSEERDYEASRKYGQSWKKILRDLSLIFPVFASTLHSVKNLFPFPDPGCIDQLLVDEAGMILLHQLFPALVRCQKALVVGDPWQLSPILPFNTEKLAEYHDAFRALGLTEDDYVRYSPTAIETATAYYRAAGASGQSVRGNGILLREHHRCVPPIISLSDRLCHYGLIIKTPEKESLLGANLIAYPVEGKIDNQINLPEIKAVERIVKYLLERGYCLSSPTDEKTIGVISPYRAQADALRSHLIRRYPDLNRDSIGTVHTFQGGQKSVILLSTCRCRDAGDFQFINRRPNLLNTAVSRAKELLILVGNLEQLSGAGGYSRQLVNYILQHGEIRQLP